jgi:NAD(P)-dependent dehydrogenase (short-subunit alcohol dehydrogenase family)
MSKTLTGKVALVTDGSRGIGAAIAKALAAEGVLTSFPAPSITMEAAAQSLAVMVDFHQLAMTLGAHADLLIIQAHGRYSPC